MLLAMLLGLLARPTPAVLLATKPADNLQRSPMAFLPLVLMHSRPLVWISAGEVAGQPMSGEAWEDMKAAADSDLGTPTVAEYNAVHDVNTLAVALVYARTGDEWYRQKAAAAIQAVIGTEAGGLAVMLSRNLLSYIIAADLISLQGYDPALDAQFRDWISAVRYTEFPDGTMINNHEKRANNHGTVAGASRAAIAIYLDETEELARTAEVFRGWLGDRTAYAGFNYGADDMSWHVDPNQPVAINPPGAFKDGFPIGGAMPEEMRRGCPFQVPPCQTDYPWGGLQGALAQAMILSRQGYDVWTWQDQALLRAVYYLDSLEQQYGGWWASGDDTHLPWIVNFVYGTDFPTSPANIGKNMGWTDWMYGH
jgi:hypothetical protein